MLPWPTWLGSSWSRWKQRSVLTRACSVRIRYAAPYGQSCQISWAWVALGAIPARTAFCCCPSVPARPLLLLRQGMEQIVSSKMVQLHCRKEISCFCKWAGPKLMIQYFSVSVFHLAFVEDPRHNCVGTSLLPPAEHALADWEGTVAQRSQQKLEKLAKDIQKLEACQQQHHEAVYCSKVLMNKTSCLYR